MDSMNNLHGSLPLSSARRNAVLAPFRETACSLTAFFKTASAEIDRAYADGARSALEQLLGAMDRENMGLQEGEGWRVRQLVMNLYEGLQTDYTTSASATSPEQEEQSERASPTSSPVRQFEPTRQTASSSSSTTQPPFQSTIPQTTEVAVDTATSHKASTLSASLNFTFNSPQPVMIFNSQPSPLSPSPSQATRTPPMRPTNLDHVWDFRGLNYFPQGMTKHIPTTTTTTTTTTTLGPGAGIKRRSKSPADVSGASAPPTPKRTRRLTPEQ